MSRKLSKNEVLKRFNDAHFNDYDYNKFEYLGKDEESIITCKIHGDFKQSPKSHWNGHGCPNCGEIKRAEKRRIDPFLYLQEVKKIHNNFYKYPDFDLKKQKDRILIECPIHGIFPQIAWNHKNGRGCPYCANEIISRKLTSNIDDFIDKSLLVHTENTIENYNNSIYINNSTELIIKCNEHGYYNQTPASHLRGSNGCKKCNCISSKAENEILEFISNYIKCEPNDRKIIKPYEIDIYIPDLKIGIEYNGLIWHSDRFKDDKNYHLKKLELSNSNNVQLVQIFADEWLNKQEIVESRLLNIIGKTPNKIYARKCEIRTIKSSDARSFLDLNHIQGFVGGSVYLGLFHNSELVSVMTFGSLRKNLGQESKEGSFELLRFCNKLNTTVIGGASKLFKHFIKKYDPKEVISYADRRWSEGNLYTNLGFEFLSKSIPNYYYTKGLIRENRFKFRKSELIKKGFNPDKTEKQIMIDQGYYRIYDCGTLKFIWKKDS